MKSTSGVNWTCTAVEWIHLTQYRDQWRALVKRVGNLQILHKIENFSTGRAYVFSLIRRSLLDGVSAVVT